LRKCANVKEVAAGPSGRPLPHRHRGNGLIRSITLLYDMRRWPEFLQSLASAPTAKDGPT
jgi:hypothetical protein